MAWLKKQIENENGTWSTVDMTVEEKLEEYKKALSICYALREAEYPKVADYLDAVAKGDLVGQQEWVDKQLAVKAKYPKPDINEYVS